ncbi:hypothetical protein EVAR_2315_1 [Eumeta japonica]|uniref:Uncharacterized protein n=1 Tax=Eumeta variegata TaxID=151549 RepID=A0A4C1SG28_EUMVA|nr:hypothetical protein EVAR_2315_1 [Eumeta japonica]
MEREKKTISFAVAAGAGPEACGGGGRLPDVIYSAGTSAWCAGDGVKQHACYGGTQLLLTVTIQSYRGSRFDIEQKVNPTTNNECTFNETETHKYTTESLSIDRTRLMNAPMSTENYPASARTSFRDTAAVSCLAPHPAGPEPGYADVCTCMILFRLPLSSMYVPCISHLSGSVASWVVAIRHPSPARDVKHPISPHLLRTITTEILSRQSRLLCQRSSS